MKKKLYIKILTICIFMVVLTACSDKIENVNTYQPKIDYQTAYFSQGIPSFITDSETGYYFLIGSYIYYTDKSTMKPVLLDNRPESEIFSENDKSNSPAYINLGEFQGFLTFYDKKLYTIECISKTEKQTGRKIQQYQLVSMSKDGSARKVITNFDFPPQSIIIHRGYVFYTSKYFTKNNELKYNVNKLSLKGVGKSKTVIYEGKLKDGYIQDLYAYGNNLYFNEYGGTISRIIHYDLEKSVATRILTDDDKVYPSMGGIYKDRLICSFFKGDIDEKEGWEVYTSDLEGNNIEKLPVKSNFLSIELADRNYFYVRPVWFYLTLDKYKNIKNTMSIYDDKFKQIQTVDLSFLPLSHQLVIGDDEYMFATYLQNDNNIVKCYDKKKINSSNTKFETILKAKKQN